MKVLEGGNIQPAEVHVELRDGLLVLQVVGEDNAGWELEFTLERLVYLSEAIHNGIQRLTKERFEIPPRGSFN